MKQTIHAMLAKVSNYGWKQVKPEQCLAFEDNEQMACSHHQNDAGHLFALVTVSQRSYIICWRRGLGMFGWLCC